MYRKYSLYRCIKRNTSRNTWPIPKKKRTNISPCFVGTEWTSFCKEQSAFFYFFLFTRSHKPSLCIYIENILYATHIIQFNINLNFPPNLVVWSEFYNLYEVKWFSTRKLKKNYNNLWLMENSKVKKWLKNKFNY
jgi:hypothetical protein